MRVCVQVCVGLGPRLRIKLVRGGGEERSIARVRPRFRWRWFSYSTYPSSFPSCVIQGDLSRIIIPVDWYEPTTNNRRISRLRSLWHTLRQPLANSLHCIAFLTPTVASTPRAKRALVLNVGACAHSQSSRVREVWQLMKQTCIYYPLRYGKTIYTLDHHIKK